MHVDKIYGFLGVYNPYNILPDYQKTARDLYQEVTVKVIESEQDLEILREVYTNIQPVDEELARLASWTPNWCQAWDQSEHPQNLCHFFDASRGTRLSVTFEADVSENRILKARGIELGAVRNIQEVLERDTEISAFLYWPNIHDVVTELFGREATLSDRDLDLITARVLIADQDRGRRASSDTLIADYRAFKSSQKDLTPLPLVIEFTDDTPESVKRARKFHDGASSACLNRVVFSTNNHIGLGPKLTELDDIAVILFGCRWPVILRPVGEQYTFVGLAYIHGVMDGEAVQGDTLDEKIFSIR